jgi:hypothetical protein
MDMDKDRDVEIDRDMGMDMDTDKDMDIKRLICQIRDISQKFNPLSDIMSQLRRLHSVNIKLSPIPFITETYRVPPLNSMSYQLHICFTYEIKYSLH